MPFHLGDPLQTMARAYQQICQGEDPWIALGNFMNDWFAYAKDQREALVADPVSISTETPRSRKRWAVFIAASVEWLCARYQVPCPQWVYDPIYQLARPWWYEEHANHPTVRAHLIATTPEPFTRRNIYCGNRIYNNKYELNEITTKLKELRAQQQASPGRL